MCIRDRYTPDAAYTMEEIVRTEEGLYGVGRAVPAEGVVLMPGDAQAEDCLLYTSEHGPVRAGGGGGYLRRARGWRPAPLRALRGGGAGRGGRIQRRCARGRRRRRTMKLFVINGPNPVSYTHLDVYKRQRSPSSICMV